MQLIHGCRLRVLGAPKPFAPSLPLLVLATWLLVQARPGLIVVDVQTVSVLLKTWALIHQEQTASHHACEQALVANGMRKNLIADENHTVFLVYSRAGRGCNKAGRRPPLQQAPE
ncbi:hypothetical protein COO60DRAFT_1131952 [Scenedesmus sp. NREL 46B-D3]|nr:hypothetical protein COO60DRAFT_1131952 [Scenedesmus sp. NREL 46B-D3]